MFFGSLWSLVVNVQPHIKNTGYKTLFLGLDSLCSLLAFSAYSVGYICLIYSFFRLAKALFWYENTPRRIIWVGMLNLLNWLLKRRGWDRINIIAHVHNGNGLWPHRGSFITNLLLGVISVKVELAKLQDLTKAFLIIYGF